jgi:predicted ATPase
MRTHREILAAKIKEMELTYDYEELQDVFSIFIEDCEETSPENAYRLALNALEEIQNDN